MEFSKKAAAVLILAYIFGGLGPALSAFLFLKEKLS